MSSPPPSSPPPPPLTAESAVPSPIPPSVGPHGSDPLPAPTSPPPESSVPRFTPEGADPVKAPVTSVPPPAPETETDGADSAAAAASPKGPVPPGVTNSGQPTTIPRPTYKEERQAGFPFDLLGIGRDKVDREPLRTCVTEVYRGQATWRTSTKIYKELPEEERGAAEQQLQSKLEKLYPATSSVAGQVRACREWLPGVLLARRHRDRRNTWARRKEAA